MTDDELRELLAQLARTEGLLGWQRAPAGYVRVLETSALAAGAERDHARAWVVDNGGALQQAPPTRYGGLRPASLTDSSYLGPLAYLIPERALSAT